jgi:predicted SAM-dependent methyltransferase
VPDRNNPNPFYYEYCRPGGSGQSFARLFLYAPDEPEHKVFYNFQTLSELIARAGLRPKLLEYHDAAGVFHRNAWSQGEGAITRCYGSPYNRWLHRPWHGFDNLSLIVDAMK